MTCKDCIHQESCVDWAKVRKGNDRSVKGIVEQIIEGEHYGCEFFKDRSKFIELPCEVGDTVYILHRYKDGNGFLQEVTVSGIHLRDTIGYRGIPRQEYLVVRGACNLSSHVKLKDIGKTIFFTKEEAEQALRERNNETR